MFAVRGLHLTNNNIPHIPPPAEVPPTTTTYPDQLFGQHTSTYVSMVRRRLIRKAPLWERIRHYPFDVLLLLNESRLSIDWDDYIPQTIPVGTGLSLVFAALCKIHNYYVAAIERRENAVFNTNHAAYQQAVNRAIYGHDTGLHPRQYNAQAAGRHFVWGFQLACCAVFLVSLANATYVLLYPYRDYTLLSRSGDGPRPRGSNVTKRSISNANEGGIISRVLAYFEENTLVESESESDGDTTYDMRIEEKDVWVLRVWDPSLFQLHLLATFSPAALALIWLTANVVALWKIAVAVTLVNATGYTLTTRFLQLVTDRQIIYQETFNEYNKKYVIPKTSVLRKDAMVDATHGPMAAAALVVHDDLFGHLQRDNTFYTHDIKGNRIKSVRADHLQSSRSASPARSPQRYSEYLSPVLNRKFDSRGSGLFDRLTFIDDTHSGHSSLITLSTPFLRRAANESFRNDTFNRTGTSFSRANDTFGRIVDSPGRRNDVFRRPASRPQSPDKSPSRHLANQSLTYNQRTQLSPSRFSTGPGSPNRSPSPSKRRWH